MAAILAGMTAGIRFGWPDTVYTSWPMTVLWGCTAVAATILIIRTRLYRRPVTAAIHLGLLMILAGACVTHFYGVDGSMHLRVGDPPSLTVSLSHTPAQTHPAIISANSAAGMIPSESR